jgi:hypothetical protein
VGKGPSEARATRDQSAQPKDKLATMGLLGTDKKSTRVTLETFTTSNSMNKKYENAAKNQENLQQ